MRSDTPRTKKPSTLSRRRSGASAAEFDPKHRVGHLLRRAYYRAKASANDALDAEGITPMQAAAIMVLYERASTSQAELGRAIGMAAGNVHSLLTRLKKAGFVELSADGRDSRKSTVALSALGHARANRIAQLTAHAAESTLAVFSATECEQFFALLRRYAGAGEDEAR